MRIPVYNAQTYSELLRDGSDAKNRLCLESQHRLVALQVLLACL